MSSTSVTSEPGRAISESPSFDQIAFANLSYLLSKAFSSPLEMDKELPEQMRQIASELPPPADGKGLLLARCWTDALKDRESFSLNYARLFLGPFEILASPYASFYLESDQRIMGALSQQVANAYATAGLVPGSGPREVPDHVALEWEFVYFLTYQHVETGDAQWLEQRDQFFKNHMAHWMPALANGISQSQSGPFYNALADFMTAVFDSNYLV